MPSPEAAASGGVVVVQPASQASAEMAGAFAAADAMRRLDLCAEVALAISAKGGPVTGGRQTPSWRWRVTVQAKGEGLAFALYDSSSRRRHLFSNLGELLDALKAKAGAS